MYICFEAFIRTGHIALGKMLLHLALPLICPAPNRTFSWTKCSRYTSLSTHVGLLLFLASIDINIAQFTPFPAKMEVGIRPQNRWDHLGRAVNNKKNNRLRNHPLRVRVLVYYCIFTEYRTLGKDPVFMSVDYMLYITLPTRLLTVSVRYQQWALYIVMCTQENI